jgi:hypothetical protein
MQAAGLPVGGGAINRADFITEVFPDFASSAVEGCGSAIERQIKIFRPP